MHSSTFLHSADVFGGEIQYFRLEKRYWKPILQKFKEAGLKNVTTYVEKATGPLGVAGYDFYRGTFMSYSGYQSMDGAKCGQASHEYEGLFRIVEHAGRQASVIDPVHSTAKLGAAPLVILPDMIATGADIIDVDHLVPSMAAFAPLLGPRQVFSGKTDPVSCIQNGTPEQIATDVADCRAQAAGRVIGSAGCEITPDTTEINMRAFHGAATRPL